MTEPSTTDPLCQAVMKASMAGIIVIASAGNAGKADDGSPILGGISSPGTRRSRSPSGRSTRKALRAVPTTSWRRTARAVPTKFENAVKPDVVAPGNKIISLETYGSYLQRTYPQFHMAGKPSNGYMHLSGTSMSAAVVTGGAALLMQAHPNITTEQLKMALQSGSTYMVDGGLMGGGAGSVNFWASRKMASSGLTNILSTLVGGVLTPASGVIYWDQGTMTKRLYRGYGLRVLSLLEAPLAWLTSGYLRSDELNLIGLNNPLSRTHPNEVIWGDVSRWTADQEVIWGDHITNPEGQEVIWGDSTKMEGEEVIWGDSVQTRSIVHDSTRNWLRVWVLAVDVIGALVIVQSLISLQTTPHRYEWLFFALLTAVAGSFSLKIGSISARVTISDTFFITTALLFGPAPATLAVALGTLVSSWRRGHARDRVTFNTVDVRLCHLGRQPGVFLAGGRAAAHAGAIAGREPGRAAARADRGVLRCEHRR